MNQLAYPHAIRDIISEYYYKQERLADQMREFEKARNTLNQSALVTGGFIPDSFSRDQYLSHANGQRMLLASAWKALYLRLNLDKVFSATDENLFEQSLENPPELTLENLKSTFGDYWENPRYYVLKGLVDVFCRLDKFYKSHSNFGIGVKGLPKRVILPRFATTISQGSKQFIDMCRAMLLVTGEATLKDDELRAISDASFNRQDFELPRLGLKIKIFANSNAHVHFSPRALSTINDALHEFYGEVLPDESGERPDKKQASTEVSKDLQFYRTPKEVIDRILNNHRLIKGDLVLEPSCGDGAILDALKEKGCKTMGVEFDAGRCNQSRAKGHQVIMGNFLELEPHESFDAVVMNPPFYGKHYVKHVEHALKFLKVGGELITILPASAWYEHKLLRGKWTDLPTGSFRESGTNINTGYLRIRK